MIVLITGLFCLAIVLFYEDSKVKKIPIEFSKWENEVSQLKVEINNIPVPSTSEITDTEDLSKRGKTKFLSVTYKTRLSENQFLAEIKTELEKRKFIFAEKRQGATSFCRSKLEAVLYNQGYGGIFSDGKTKYKLIFLSSFNDEERISHVCE